MTSVFALDRGVVDYDGNRALTNASLHVEGGEFVAVLGENGSGKTTLMRALLGLSELRSGTVRIFDTPLPRFRDWARIGYVPQRLISAGAVPVSVAEVVTASRISPATRWRAQGSRRRSAVQAALESVGLWERRADRLDELSGGQQRRVLIAAALAKGASVFVLDEPTAGVDAEHQASLTTVFAGIRDAGGTVLLVTHELGPFSGLATRVVLLDGGRITFDGPPPGPRHHHDPVWHHSEDEQPVRRSGPLEGGTGVHES